mmetsp:Transcript_10552/g.23373  ORF Transcript_10552/g.23373 Transcript_10552/m.23373 type:complete len:600 (-) Transcript_10552:43-1842(-)
MIRMQPLDEPVGTPFLPQDYLTPSCVLTLSVSLAAIGAYDEVRQVAALVFVVVLVTICSLLLLREHSWTRRRKRDQKKAPLPPLTLIQLANGPYMSFAEPLPLLGWTRLKRYVPNENNNNNKETNQKQQSPCSSSGPCIDVFYHKRDQQLVLSVRGTDPTFVGDLSQDLDLFHDRVKAFVEGDDRHQLPSYAMDLLRAMKDWERAFPNCQLYLTGHSLGAACCEAAWTADLSLKAQAAAASSLSNDDNHTVDDFQVWRCVTWESPGFAVNTVFQQTLNQYRDILDSHVVHYLGAPNVINCLHSHISTNRRYRIFLGHDNKLTSWHLVECLWRNAVVLMNWICLARIGINVAGGFLFQAAEVADVAAAAAAQSAPAFSMEPHALWKYIAHEWHRIFSTSSCPGSGANLRAAANVLTTYDQKLGQSQILLSGWFKNIMPIGDKLTWSVVRGNALLQGDRAVEYLLRQHSLRNHIDSFDIRSGYPLKWSQMDSWPTLSEIVVGTLWESARSCVVPILPDEILNPEREIETKVGRLRGYSERRQCTADFQVLKEHYNYLGNGFFDTLLTFRCRTPPLSLLEEQCRDEYRRCRRQLPTPVFMVG